MTAISNSSPLILFAAIHRLDLLPAVYGEILVPSAVWNEVVATGTGRPGATELVEARWIRRRDPLKAIELPTQLDAGEAAVLALAIQLGELMPVVLDDRKGRRAATQLELPVIGSAGVLLLAKDRGLVARVGPVLDDLRRAGLYLSEHAAQRLLQLAGEA